jgi:polar amino acid transport system permease protein
MTLDAQNALKPPPGIPGRATGNTLDLLGRLPWWAIAIVVLGLGLGLGMLTGEGEGYRSAFAFVQSGIIVTLVLSVTSYTTALILGLIAGLGRVSKNVVFYTVSTLYVEIVRGIPLLVQIIVIAYLIVPWLINDVLNGYFFGELHWLPQRVNVQSVGYEYRAIVALAIGYGAYLAEIYRAGIESISKGQMEAARSLGMNYTQAMRYVILPQAFRIILPPLGNDFIAMLKDSSLVSVVTVQDLTFRGRLKISNSFDTFTVWYVVSYVYLLMTLSLSALVRLLERRTSTPR